MHRRRLGRTGFEVLEIGYGAWGIGGSKWLGIGPDSTFPEGDLRNDYFRDCRREEVDERVRAIVADLGISRDGLAETALRHILSSDAVSTVIPGMRSVRNVELNTASVDGRGLPAEQVRALERHRWTRNFYA